MNETRTILRLSWLLMATVVGATPVLAKDKKTRASKAQAAQIEAAPGPRVLIYSAAEADAPPAVLVKATETAKIDAPVFYVTIGSEGDGGHAGKVQVEERAMTLEPSKAAPAGKSGKRSKKPKT